MTGILTFIAFVIMVCAFAEHDKKISKKDRDPLPQEWMVYGMFAAVPTAIINAILAGLIG